MIDQAGDEIDQHRQRRDRWCAGQRVDESAHRDRADERIGTVDERFHAEPTQWGVRRVQHAVKLDAVTRARTRRGYVGAAGPRLLTGAIRSMDQLADDDWRKTCPRFMGENFQRNLRIADEVIEVASRGRRHAGAEGPVLAAGQGR